MKYSKTPSTILIVEDQAPLRESLQNWLSAYYEVQAVASGEECLELLGRLNPGAILLDQRLPRMSGLDVLQAVVPEYPDLPVIMMTAFGSIDQAVDAIKLGAADYLIKPVDLTTLKLRLDKLLGYSALAEENLQLRRELEGTTSFHSIITGDPAMKEMCRRIETVAYSDAPVLITGESGTGKELVARAVHEASQRAQRPFVAVPCGAIPDTLIESEVFGHEKGAFTDATHRRIGKLEEAADGTVFLDEIAELTGMAQVKFLRVLQEREFQRVGGSHTLPLQARIVSATNQTIEETIETGEFRQDLYYRINTIRIDLPPLRARAGDVLLLARHFVEHFARRYAKPKVVGIEPDAMRYLREYSWPGNVRELRGAIEQATILCSGAEIGRADLPGHITGASADASATTTDFHQQMHDFGEAIVRRALANAGGVKRDAASQLGLSQRALSHYLKKFGIS
jgi:DNA-binding NtrC family response regulator